jgi:hypothetical protein
VRFEVLVSLAAWELRPAGHGFFGWRADELEDAVTLVEVGFAFEDRFAFEHFAEDTSGQD